MHLCRRRFLELIGLMAGSGLLAACGTSPSPSAATTGPATTSTSAPPTVPAQGKPAAASPAANPAASPGVKPAATPIASPVPNAAVGAPSPSPAAASVSVAVVGKPMYQVDAQHTGRSPYAGPRRPAILRHFDTSVPELLPPDAVVPRADVQSSTVIGPDGTIYVTNFPGWLLALRDSAASDGLDLVWKFRPPGGTPLHATPALGRDGTVYLGFSVGAGQAGTSALYALRAQAAGGDPQVSWTVDLGPGRTTSSATLGPDGTIYMLSGSGQLYAVSAAGQTRWTAQAGPALKGSPALAPDGTVYQASTDGKLYAIAPPSGAGTQGSVKWTFDFGEHLGPTPLVTSDQGGGANGIGSGSTPTVGPDGTIYIGANNSNFYAIASDGRQKWLFEAERDLAGIWSAACLSADNTTLYFGANKGGVYALSAADGSRRWQFEIYGSIYASPALDKQGILYLGTSIEHVYGIDTATARPIWDVDVNNQVWSAPSLRPDGTLVVADRGGQVWVLGDR